MMFALARRLADDGVALVASLLLATILPPLLFPRGGSYTAVDLLQLASMYFLWRGLFQGKMWMWIAYLLTTAVGLYTHYFAFILLAAQGAFVLCIGFVTLLRQGHHHGLPVCQQSWCRMWWSWWSARVSYLPWYRTLLSHTQLLLNVGRFPTRTPVSGTQYLGVLLRIWSTFAERQPALSRDWQPQRQQASWQGWSAVDGPAPPMWP